MIARLKFKLILNMLIVSNFNNYISFSLVSMLVFKVTYNPYTNTGYVKNI